MMPSNPTPVQRVFTEQITIDSNEQFGQHPNHVLYVVNGCAVREDATGKALSIIWPGELVCASTGARALVPCRCLAAPRSVVERHMQTDAEFASWLVMEMSHRQAELHKRIDWFVNRRAEDRILSVLWDQTERALATTGVAAIPLAQLQVAQLAGATRETASMLLHRLRDQGLLDYRRRCIQVPDASRLQSFVQASIPSRQ